MNKFYCRICEKELKSLTERAWRTGKVKWRVPTEGITPTKYSVEDICSKCMPKIHERILKIFTIEKQEKES